MNTPTSTVAPLRHSPLFQPDAPVAPAPPAEKPELKLEEALPQGRETRIDELAKAVKFCQDFTSLPRKNREAYGLTFITSKVPTIIMSLLRTKDAAYQERNKLLAYLSQKFPSHLTEHDPSDATWDDMWRTIVVIALPEGETSWHIHDHEIKLFEHLELKPYAKESDPA
jgi:hypothetical protein